MKGLKREKSGWRLQITPPGQRRIRIRLGDLPDDDAEAISNHVRRILVARVSGAPLALDTAEWLGNLPPGLQGRLMAQGVIDESMVRPAEITLGAFLDLYFKRPEDRAWRTINQLKIARNNLLIYFGADRSLRSITAGEAIDYRKWLAQPRGKAKTKWAVATVNRICGRAKEMFQYAKSRGFIDHSPFEAVKGLTVRANPAKQFMVHPDLTAQIMDAMPDTMWRLIFALARYCGLRSPSEQRLLRWEHVRWEEGKIDVYCKKTERYEGRLWKTIPIWPELRPYLEAARAEAPASAEWVIADKYRGERSNPTVEFARHLKRAGIPLYPKLMQNLRFTRSQELVDQGWPENVVQAWIGHSARMAKEHYRCVTEEHFQRAIGNAKPSQADSRAKPWVKPGSPTGKKDAQGHPNPHGPGRRDRGNPRETRESQINHADRPIPPNARERT